MQRKASDGRLTQHELQENGIEPIKNKRRNSEPNVVRGVRVQVLALINFKL